MNDKKKANNLDLWDNNWETIRKNGIPDFVTSAGSSCGIFRY